MFGDPAWDILLDLYVARVRGKPISISSACIAAGTSSTTGLRWLRRLERSGAIVRKPDPADARRSFLELQPTTFLRLTAWLMRARGEL
jgi:DNA-binding MarR family transcriptional regulator